MALSDRGITLEKPYSPEIINQELIKGKTREELAKEYGHKDFKAIDMYMRRKGYRWDREKQMYVSNPKNNKEQILNEGTKKVNQILKLFEQGKDPKEVAKIVGFSSHRDLANYMKDKGYVFNSKTYQYELEKEEGPSTEEGPSQENIKNNNYSEQAILEVVMNNREKLVELLEMSDPETLPRYKVPGYKINKCIQLPHTLDALVKEFSEESNISQREIIEIGLIEALKKYGYSDEVKGIIS